MTSYPRGLLTLSVFTALGLVACSSTEAVDETTEEIAGQSEAGAPFAEGGSASPGDSATVDANAPEAAGEADPIEELCRAYCAMEAGCIPYCLVDIDQTGTALVACNSSERTIACPDDCALWASRHTGQSAACDATFNAWAACITSVGCEDVETFFRHHPDGVVAGDPCAAEYHALECQDFEPPTEYSFSN